jgi:eukaryotic-like serine/threonine-protein kinase
MRAFTFKKNAGSTPGTFHPHPGHQRTESKRQQNLCFGARFLRRSTLANTGFGAKNEPTKHRDGLYPEPASPLAQWRGDYARLARNLAVIALITALGVSMAFAAQTDWPSFRGNPQMTGVASSTLPAKPRLLWTYETGSEVESTAAIAGDMVFLGTKKGAVVALKLSDGKLRWKFRAKDSVTASPCVAGNAVYVGDESGMLYALNRTNGKMLWKHPAKDKIISSATVVADSVLFGSYDNHLYCLSTKTGKLKWKFEAEAQVHCSPCVAEGKVMIAGCDGCVRIIDLSTGKERAKASLDTNMAVAPAYGAGAVYVGSLTGDYLAVRVRDGEILWRRKLQKDGGIYASAAVSGQAVVFASRNRTVFLVDAKTGKVRWVFKAGGDSSPVIAGSTVYVGSDDGNLYGIDIKNGRRLWQFKAGSEIKASPAISRGRMVIGAGDGAVYCFGK